MSKLEMKVFNSAYFPDHVMDLVSVWYDDRYRLCHGLGHFMLTF